MSLTRLTVQERATYLLGVAALRQLEQAPRDPDTQREIEAFCRWVTHWLSADELGHVMTQTGFLFDPEDLAVDPSGPSASSQADDPDTPF